MKTLIQNGVAVTEEGALKADMLIEDGKIAAIGSLPPEESAVDALIDAQGCYILPGGIDVHTHLDWNFADLKTADDFATGSKAAAAGGITSIINFTNRREGQSLYGDLMEWKERAKPCNVDYGFHVIINDYNEAMLQDLPKLAEAGVSSIKLFMAYKDVFQVNDGTMYEIMKETGRLGIMTNVHAENGDVIERLIAEHLREGKTSPIYHSLSRPPELEAEAAHRAIAIADLANAPLYIVHVSSALCMDEIAAAKAAGKRVYGETCPQYLALDITDLERQDGSKYICSPPLRERWNQEKLWAGLAGGTLSTIGSDHSPFHYAEKERRGGGDFSKVPNGVPMIEDQYAVVFHHGVMENRISIETFVRITSTNPAKLFGMYPRKGAIAVGSDADLVVMDPNKTRVITQAAQQQNVDYNVFEGKEVRGLIRYVLSRGELIARQGAYVGREGRGEYIHRQPINDKMNV
ncbi:dihydropyrimidinase [Paenibacillus humicola]|uniref:dihydropyrimidinase n=1 Tax=Paenibacillus humicola TaxID=3110540 RepID=UPI00237AA50D|nr:dihydropyrimidinase [Paenibacillus humicola]